jgi:hemerythrin-like domain-containing protein
VSSSVPQVDTTDMLLIHRVIRREIAMLPDLIRKAAGDRRRAALVATHAAEMLDMLHIHHTGEDELVWPLLLSRVDADDGLIERMQEQHTEIAAAIDDVRAQLPAWAASADGACGEQIAVRLEDAMQALRAHLAEEEERILPLAAKHLSQGEWDALGEHGLGAIPRRRRLVILGHILEEADADERRRFLTKIPSPARLAYSVVGRRQFARETAAIRG